jgi:hypothetical protein
VLRGGERERERERETLFLVSRFSFGCLEFPPLRIDVRERIREEELDEL